MEIGVLSAASIELREEALSPKTPKTLNLGHFWQNPSSRFSRLGGIVSGRGT